MTPKAELIGTIGEQLFGLNAPAVKIEALQRRLEKIKEEFEALKGPTAKDVRDNLVSIHETTKRAAKAIADAVDLFEDNCRKLTGFSTTDIANLLHNLSTEANRLSKSVAVRAVANDASKKLCAFQSFLLVEEMAGKPATLTPSETYITVATQLFEFLTGLGEEPMATACREVVEGKFPAVAKLDRI